MLKRLIAVLTTLVLAVGLTVGVATTATAHTPTVSATCTGIKVTLSSYGAGTSNTFTLTVDGTAVASNVAFGNNFGPVEYPVDGASAHTWKLEIDAQHNEHDKLGAGALTGSWAPCAGTALTCDVASLIKGSPLREGDHINMNVTRNGGGVFQVNASVDIRQPQDPASESGLVVRIRLDSGDLVLPLTNAQKNSGILAFEYSKQWTGTWQVRWVQYNNKYFNQDNLAINYKNCQRDTPVTVTAEPSATQPTCSADGRLVLPTPPTGMTWEGGTDGDGPGTYTIIAKVAEGYTLGDGKKQWVIQVLPKGTGMDCGPPPCIAASQVSYTYDPRTNSGTVTVPNPAGSSGKLCDGFWVTAVSWKFAGKGQWPQNLHQNNPMPAKDDSFFVEYPGTYHYGADVECGQGDIYASYDAQPVPTSVLNGPNDPFEEHFLHDMGFTGPKPTYTVDTPGCNKVAPVAPIATPITACDTDGSLTLGPTEGVVYTLTVGDGQSGPWKVVATPATNHYFQGPQTVTFTGDLGQRTDCAEAVEPEVTQAVCTTETGVVTSAFLVVPDTEGVRYRVDGTVYPAGQKVELGVGDHTVVAEALEGYTLVGQTSFPVTIDETPDCDDPVEYVAPVVTHEICDAPTGEIQGASILFTDVANLTYFLDGVEIVFADGETEVAVPVTAGPHTITARTADGFYLKGTELLTEKDYPVTVETPDACDDPVEYVAPIVKRAECNREDGGVNGGIITFTLVDNLSYIFDGEVVDADHLVFERGPGSYELVVTAADGFYIKGGGSTATYPIEVTAPDGPCDEGTDIPVQPFVSSHEECVDGSVEGEKLPGSITITSAPHVTWQISSDTDQVKHDLATPGDGPWVFDYPAGSYTVWAVADDGYVIRGPSSFPVTIAEPELPCDLTTHAELPTAVSWTHEQCTPAGRVMPTITVTPFPGVSYFLDGQKITQKTTRVEVGEYVVTAQADDPENTVTRSEWRIKLRADDSVMCGDLTTLALTGETPGGWLVLALVLLQAGLALVAIQIVRARRPKGRHLAV